LIERWDGTGWLTTPVPWDLDVTAVAASSAGDAWLVGNNGFGAMILRWNGVRWLRVARRQKAELRAITALTATDVWAVGNDKEERLLALHWNGLRWKAYVMSAGAGHDLPSSLDSVSGAASEDVWAVGSGHVAGLNGYDADPIVRHWDGSRWTLVRPTDDESALLAVAAPAGAEPWISGIDFLPFAQYGGRSSFLAVHTRTGWQMTPIPQRLVKGLALDDSGSIWAVGLLGHGIDESGTGFPLNTTPLIERYSC